MWQEITKTIEPLSIEGVLTAVLCGLIIGFERQWKNKPAGIRTSILVCMGAYIFIALATFHSNDVDDGSLRVLGQVVTGVGFLGAGIMIAKQGFVIGVTSATIIWLLAAIGSLIGFKHYIPAISISVLSVIVLVGINFLENLFIKLKRGSNNDD